MLVSQTIDNLLNGVSQQPKAQRLASQAEEQVNGLSRFADGGPSKRPGTAHVAKLSSDITAADSGFIHPINMGEGAQYFVVITNGELRVYDKLTGVTVPVLTPHGTDYITERPREALSFILDTFTDVDATVLSAHEADSQNVWTSLNANPEATIRSNRVRVNATQSGESYYRLNYQPPVADYTVSATLLLDSNTAERGGVVARIPLSGLGGYEAELTSGASFGIVKLYKRSATTGQQNLLLTHNLAFTVADTPYELAIRVTGTTIEALFEGDVVLTTTDSEFADAGNPGLAGTGAAFGQGADVLLDDFTVSWELVEDTAPETYRAVTVGNRTFLTNTTVQVEQDTTRKAPTQTPQALVYVEQADFATQFSVTIDGVSVSYTTPAGTDAAQRGEIDTNAIATRLAELLNAAFTSFAFDQFGSMIRVRRDDGADFTIAATDGLADNGLLVLKNTVQRTTDLPLRCVDGYVLEVVGGPEEAKDTYWVEFDSQGSDDFRGVWKECVRPGEGIAFDHTTLPHELIYSSEITERFEARGFPAQPVITAANPVKAAHAWQGTQDGAVNENDFIFMQTHGSDTFVNLTDANGGPLKLEIRYLVNTNKLADGETFYLTLAINDSASPGAGTFTDVAQVAYTKGVYKNEVWIVDIGTNVPSAYDIRLTTTYSGGSTPAEGSRATIVLLPYENSTDIPGFQYTRYSGRDVTWPTDTVYPKGTAWNIDVGGLDANYVQTSDMTGAAIAAAMEPIVEALAGVDSTLVTNERGTAIRITLAAGGLPTVTATGTFDSATRFWNPDITLGYNGDELDGKILKNLSDGSEGVITDCYGTGITVASMTGGVDNEIRNGDLCVVEDTSARFTFRQLRWSDRAAGDSVTNPWPSIRDGFVRDVFYTRGRLGLLSGGNIVLSEAGKPENLFRTATTDLLDADPIDTKPATSGSANFHSAVDWDGRFLMWTDTAQFELQGEPLLTPATVALPQLTKFDSSPVRPLVVGSRIYFVRGMTSATRVFEYRVRQSNDRPDAVDITRDLPSYIAGYPKMIVGDTALGFVAVLTDADPTHLYTYSAHYEDNQQFQSAWSRWEFAADSTIIGMDLVDGTLGIIFVRSDGIYLELLDLDDTSGLLLDRRLEDQSGTYAANKTTWTLPYSIPTDGSEGTVVVVVNGAVVSTTRPTATTVATTADVDLSASDATIGVRYDFRYTLSDLYPRDREGRADTRGRLQLSRARLHYKDSREFDVEVTPTGRATRTYAFAETSAQDGEFPFQIGTRNTTALIEFVNDSPFQCILAGLDWEGTLVNRSRRI
jgi:hypothetical protein